MGTTHHKLTLLDIFAYIIWGISFLCILTGFKILSPNQESLILLFGKYKGYIDNPGLYFFWPFCSTKDVSTKIMTFNTPKLKVNEKNGIPINISSIFVFRIQNTYKSIFEISNLDSFVSTQSESALRKVALEFAYELHDKDSNEITLSQGGVINLILYYYKNSRISTKI